MSNSVNSNDAIAKADQIAHRFFSKFPVVVANARISDNDDDQSGRPDKWFNLETIEKDIYKDQLRVYRSISNADNAIPSLEMQVLLSIPELAQNQALVYQEQGSSRIKVDPPPQFILLESWSLSFDRSSPHYQTTQAEVTLPTVYKHSISLFRSLYTLLRILPVWDLFKRLRRTAYNTRSGALAIQVNLGEPPPGVHDFDTPISSRLPPLATDIHAFPPISHPFGFFKIESRYLSNPAFRIDSLENLLSSGFLGLDAFTPTLSKNSIQAVSPPSSLPLRTSLPRSPPAKSASIADRFVITRPGSVASQPGGRNIPLPISRDPSQAPSNSSPRDRPEFPTRQRTESLVSNLDRPFPTALSARRPSNPSSVQPFKTGTITSGSPSSTSFRQASPLAGGPYLPSKASQTPRMIPSSGPKPSPPYTPTSLGDRAERRSIGGGSSVEGGSPGGPKPPTKRFSSSFSHRYAMPSGGVGSEGSGNSGDKDRKDDSHPGRSDEINLSESPRDLAGIPYPERQRRSSAPVMSLALHPIQPPLLTNLSQLDDTISQMTNKFQATLDSLGGNAFNRPTYPRSPSLRELGRRPSSRLATPQDSPALRTSDLPSDYSDYRGRGESGTGIGPSINPSYVGPAPIPTGISDRDRERLGSLPQARVSYETIASDDSPRAGGSGSVGSEEIMGRLEMDDRPPSLRRRYYS